MEQSDWSVYYNHGTSTCTYLCKHVHVYVRTRSSTSTQDVMMYNVILYTLLQNIPCNSIIVRLSYSSNGSDIVLHQEVLCKIYQSENEET